VELREEIETGFPDPKCHASSIVAADDELLMAFFGGPDRGREEQGIWLSRRGLAGWSPPQCVVPGYSLGDRCWNPVLHKTWTGTILLFYKQGADCSTWWGMLSSSHDLGRTWSEPERLPEGIWGPSRNKPLERLPGELLCPSSTELGPWRVHFERTRDEGRTWQRTGPLSETSRFDAIQPTLLCWPDGRIQALCRSQSGWIVESFSSDGGEAWSPLRRTMLPNPNSAIDAVLMPDGRALLIHNPSLPDGQLHGARTPLRASVSEDGEVWVPIGDLEDEPDEFSYPAVICGGDGKIHVTYTAGFLWTNLRHIVIDPAAIEKDL
jgi:predicted neuraminidase